MACDKILYLEPGKGGEGAHLAEAGSHHELMANPDGTGSPNPTKLGLLAWLSHPQVIDDRMNIAAFSCSHTAKLKYDELLLPFVYRWLLPLCPGGAAARGYRTRQRNRGQQHC